MGMVRLLSRSSFILLVSLFGLTASAEKPNKPSAIHIAEDLMEKTGKLDKRLGTLLDNANTVRAQRRAQKEAARQAQTISDMSLHLVQENIDAELAALDSKDDLANIHLRKALQAFKLSIEKNSLEECNGPKAKEDIKLAFNNVLLALCALPEVLAASDEMRDPVQHTAVKEFNKRFMSDIEREPILRHEDTLALRYRLADRSVAKVKHTISWQGAKDAFLRLQKKSRGIPLNPSGSGI